ncbi:MAG: hypothetical protein ACFBSF_00650 [Leptolyngbyaceae cyanobacterium]
MNYFSIFAILYITTFLYEMTEKWKHVGFSWAFVILLSLLVFTGINRLKFFIFLVASTAYILLFRFPEVANHVNFILLINIPLILGILYSWLRPHLTDQDSFQITSPFLRLSLVFAYFFAGFHKLNQDFFHPEVSCLGWFMGAFVSIVTTSKVLFIPSILILLGLGVVCVRLLGNPLKRLSRSLKFCLLALGTAMAIAAGGILVLMLQDSVPTWLRAVVILLVAVVVIAWEVVGGPLLLWPRVQGPILAFSAAMHASFALIGFVDFSSLALAILFCYIPQNYLDVLDKRSSVSVFQYKIHRAHAYFLILLLGSLLTGLHYRIGWNFGDMPFLHGIVFLGGTAVLFWPILATLCSTQRLPWQGIPLLNPQVNVLPVVAFALLVFFFGMNSYLGLRTAGNFSMFSNLRTEGIDSNHLLLASNPLKIWDYQDNVIDVLAINDEAAAIGHKYRPLKGERLPLVEFKKLIHKWTEANYTVPITFVHNGVTYSSQDIVNDATWQTPKRTWDMYFMDFRIIQTEGPNICRW